MQVMWAFAATWTLAHVEDKEQIGVHDVKAVTLPINHGEKFSALYPQQTLT
jgi:hypothetical protein